MKTIGTIRSGRRKGRLIAWFLLLASLSIPLSPLLAGDAEPCARSGASESGPCCHLRTGPADREGSCSSSPARPHSNGCRRSCDGCVCRVPGPGYCVVPPSGPALSDQSAGCPAEPVSPPPAPVPELDPPPPRSVDG